MDWLFSEESLSFARLFEEGKLEVVSKGGDP